MIRLIQAFSEHEFWLLIAFLVLGAIYFSLMAGCTPFRRTPPENFEIQQQPSTGYCKDWTLIELEIRRHTLCSERRKLNGYNLICNRALGHPGAHHMHGLHDCLWIW